LCTCGQVWERRRRIPSQTYNDPLDHIFTEFDSDGDGHLTADEIAIALQSRGVEATPEAVQAFIAGEEGLLAEFTLE
jgi:Ca2+-binding EF-hand superfamily protein